MIEFKECEISGNLRGIGAKADYWIWQGAWIYLDKVVPTSSGPKIIGMGTFLDIEIAKQEAQEADND